MTKRQNTQSVDIRQDPISGPLQVAADLDTIYHQLRMLSAYADLAMRAMELQDYPAGEPALDRVIGYARDIQALRRKVKGAVMS